MVVPSIIAYLLLALFPTAVWMVFFLKEDTKREPARLIIKTFFFGALSSIPVLGLQIFAERLFDGYISSFFITAVILALFEEFFKFYLTYLAVHKDPDFDEPIDPMIYMVVAGLGFATIENMFVIASVMFHHDYIFTLTAVGSAVVLRFIGATLLHTLASAVVGYFWARGMLFNKRKEFIVFGLVIATVIHAIFNTLVFQFQEINFLIPTLFLVAVSFFVFRDFENLK
ncbi:PrsW family intramembrane metalloprotease [Candidatus Parcubacteria bacterium]|jgi:RsiW-degrading membrane proteinase PrsW (M82 family)|nr:MAG: PrsW family intramembrane metalloprotease [Candidatus Parcubacteria bacterium]